MTMPKKGTRKIVVNDKTYRYKITSTKHDWYDTVQSTRIVIELPLDIYYTEKRDGLWELTPKEISEIIKREMETSEA